jgi:UDPglucose 6-dehydrogenase
MLAQRISSINSISAICEKTGADVDEVAKSIGLDPRIGSKFLRAGLGFGGSCFKKDILSLVYLAESLGLDEVAEYWQQVVSINEFQRARFVRRVVKCLNGTLIGKKLTVLGYAFKKDTNDTRESPALDSIKGLLEDAPAEIAVFDPCCVPGVVKQEIGRLLGKEVLKDNGGPVAVYSDAYQACHKAHAIIIMTECDEFKNVRVSTPNLRATKSSKAKSDPRPFQRLEPTETEILNLHQYLASAGAMADPLQRFVEDPKCEPTCKTCTESAMVVSGKGKDNESLDWSRIAYHLQRPKWVFDGRNVLDIPEMEALGVRVEGIGKVGFAGR